MLKHSCNKNFKYLTQKTKKCLMVPQFYLIEWIGHPYAVHKVKFDGAIQTAWKEKTFAQSFINIAWKTKKWQPNIPIGLFIYCPFKNFFGKSLSLNQGRISQRKIFNFEIFWTSSKFDAAIAGPNQKRLLQILDMSYI